MGGATEYVTQLVQTLGPAPSPQDLVDALVPEVADLVQMFVVHGKELRLAAYRHIDPSFHPLLEGLARIHRPSVSDPVEPVAQVIRTSQARLSTWIRRQDVQRATTDRRVHEMFDVIRPRNLIIVPLSRQGASYGALIVVLSESGRHFVEGDLEFVQELAKRVGPIVRL